MKVKLVKKALKKPTRCAASATEQAESDVLAALYSEIDAAATNDDFFDADDFMMLIYRA